MQTGLSETTVGCRCGVGIFGDKRAWYVRTVIVVE